MTTSDGKLPNVSDVFVLGVRNVRDKGECFNSIVI